MHHTNNMSLKLTLANVSKLAKSSLRILTSSEADTVEEIAVNPTMSAKRILENKTGHGVHRMNQSGDNINTSNKLCVTVSPSLTK